MSKAASFVLIFSLLSSTMGFAADKPLSLDDLGFKTTDTQSHPELQLQLEKRTDMLKTHQTLGLITAIPMIAQLFLADDVEHNAGKRNLHMGVGIMTAGLYATTASYALFAPKPADVVDKGKTRIHRILAWIHGPLMIVTPVLGAMAYHQVGNGEKVHGIASMHGGAATLLVTSYVASMAIMSFNF